MELSDYSGKVWNDHLIDKFKNKLFKSRNNKFRLKEIFRPTWNISLFYIAVQHSSSFARYLIQFAIENDVDSSLLLDSVYGETPLHVAVEMGNYELVEMILKYATDHGSQNAVLLEPTEPYEKPLFQFAIKKGKIRSMKAIFRFGVENGLDVVKLLGPNKNRPTALHYAIHKRTSYDVLRAIVTLAEDNGVNADFFFQADDEGMTLLHLACTRFDMANSVIKLARECGICEKNLIVLDEYGNSPLHYAATGSDEDSVLSILKLATDSGVDAISLFQPNLKERTPFHCAAMNCWSDTFNTLLSWATSHEVPVLPLLEGDSEGRTPLHSLAVHYAGNYAKATENILEIAHQYGRMHVILGPDQNGQTPLHLAAEYGGSSKENKRRYMVEAIMQSAFALGNDMVQTVLAPDDEGQTPLHFAAHFGKGLEPSKVIMQSAAELGQQMVQTILAPDKYGNTPLKLAIKSDCDQIYTAEAIIRFAMKRGIDWKTLIDTKDIVLRSGLKEIFQNQIVIEPWIWSTLYPPQSFVALRGSRHPRRADRLTVNVTCSDSLQDDVLYKIFEYLDALDLSNCEMVCRRWHNVLSRNIIWSKLLDRERKNGRLWQSVEKSTELKDEQFLQCGSREKCKRISRKLQDLDTNWKTGNYQMKIVTSDLPRSGDIKYDEDYLIGPSNYSDNHFIIVNKRTMEKEREFHHGFRGVSDFQIHRNIIVIASAEVLRVFDATTAEQVNEIVVPNNWRVVNLCFGHGLLAALSESSPDLPKSRQLTVWRVNSSTDIENLVDLPVAGDEDQRRVTGVAMDERYIAVLIDTWGETKMYFVSKKSWTIEDSSTIPAYKGRILHRGLLITQKDNCIRLKDVFTGDCREINLEPFGLSSKYTQIGANSKYLVVMNQEIWTRVNIFDLRKKSDCDTPLCCFEIPIELRWFEMDETELICFGGCFRYGGPLKVVIDFLSTPSIKETERKTSSGPLSNGDTTSWRFSLAKEINETLTSFNNV